MDTKTRLRKACDACSIRKVKVSRGRPVGIPRLKLISDASVMSVVRPVGPVRAWRFPAPTRDPAGAVDLQTGMPRH